MFRGLVVGIEVVMGSVIAEKSHHCTNMFACLISTGQGNVFAGGGCCHDELFRASSPVE
jgi:hypothetical protein